MNESLGIPTAPPANAPVRRAPRSGSRRWRASVRRIVVGAALIAALLVASGIASAALTAAERQQFARYGETVELEAGQVNVVRTGGPGPTLVLLSGYGTPAPGVDFAPLVRELQAYDVIVIEGFGYGYSDLDVTPRSIENITAEVHETLSAMSVDEPVIMVGHSVGGLYARYYAAAYPDEVSAIIGLDPMAATVSSFEVGSPSVTERVVQALGLFRWAAALVPDLVQPPGEAFTAEERRRLAVMANWNYGNPAIADEWARIAANSTVAAAQPFAPDRPVLQLLSSDSVATIPGWLPHHEAELEDVATHQLEVLDGGHYLHWTQAPAMARIITDFISTHVTP